MTSNSSAAAVRRPLGVRATEEQHRVLREAAEREQRSVSSFVLNAALQAAQKPEPRKRTREEVAKAIAQAQALMRPYRQEGASIVDDLIAERRAEAARE
ncbi:DUF1778 domain-containing protein [Terriglobus saanensis]|uniref:DUF1778 domain-containing protein n=1 Tax=Terriglobus saanensis (strain ATCC BAA-1853 / DSM 23119 / SP1PR4) TaxID=401053 RepID=E8V1J1_TERSS|nr:DUF1778 domain-containing protein [Terriglobus saanensis]ADV81186.1 protein of unknown function DUF1778 [Terriglobus saanensis SP1PR4]